MCGWISFQGGKQAQPGLDPCVGKFSASPSKAHLQFTLPELWGFLQHHPSVNQQSPESQTSRASTEQHGFSLRSALLFVLLPRGDVFPRGRRKKGAGSELELKEVGRRKSGRMQLSSMVSEQKTVEGKNHDTREHCWQPPVKITFTLGVSKETFEKHPLLGLWE